MTSIWTPELEDMIRQLWGEGKSAGVIAKTMNKEDLRISRNMIIGKVKRLGLLRRPSTIKAQRTPVKRKPSMPKKPVFMPVIDSPHKREVGVIRLLDLKDNECRYPFGDDPPFSFCGRKQLKGSSYCPEHQSLTRTRYVRPYVPTGPWRR